MAVAFETIGTITYASRTNTIIPAPTGITNGDLLLALVVGALAGEPVNPTPPAGFTAIPGTWPIESTLGGFNVELFAFSKVASGEAGDYTFTHATQSSAGALLRISGAATTSTFVPTPTANTGTTADTTALGLTTTVDGALIVLAQYDWADTATVLTPPAGTTPTFTTRYGGVILYVATGNMTTAGATGDKTMANNAATGNPWGATLIAVNPDVAVAGSAPRLAMAPYQGAY